MFDQVFLISYDRQPAQPVNRVVRFRLVESSTGREQLTELIAHKLGNTEEETRAELRRMMRDRLAAANAMEAFGTTLESIDKDVPLDLAVTKDEQVKLDAQAAARAMDAKFFDLQRREILVRNNVIKADDPAYVAAVDALKQSVSADDAQAEVLKSGG